LSEAEKDVLIIAYHFYPDQSVGALRPLKFAKYLPEFGWQPHVLTIGERFHTVIDKSRLSDIEGVSICRTTYWRTPLQTLIDARDSWQALTQDRKRKAQGSQSLSKVVSPARSGRFRSLIDILVSLNWLPDDKVNWVIPAVLAGYRLIKQRRIHCIISSAPPNTTGVVGMILSKLTGTPLVLDMRDPWAHGKTYPPGLDIPFYRRASSYLESKVIAAAHTVLLTTKRLEEELSRTYRSNKFVTITNGYDPEDFAVLTRKPANGRFVVAYLGNFYLDRSPCPILRAVSELIEESIISRDAIEFRFIGDVKTVAGRSLDAIVTEQKMIGNVVIREAIPYKEGLKEMVNADLLLLIAPNQPYQIPAKTFEYIAARRPILALTGEGATADLIRETRTGLIVEPEDVPGIKSAITQLYRHRTEAEFCASGEIVQEFSRRRLTHRLATALEKSCGWEN
jgi:glycosyltransferase involved in cell wall biosynthesis